MTYVPNILLKVRHFTLNNTTNNQTFMKSLQTFLAFHNVSFNANDHKIMCYMHTVDLSSSQVICTICGDGSSSNELSDESSNKSSNKSLDPISLAHAAVHQENGNFLKVALSCLKLS